MLKQSKLIQVEIHKSQYKLYEIMVASFYKIANDLSHLSEAIEAHKIYKEGYNLAQKILGHNHKLTVLLNAIIKKRKE